MRLEYFEMLDRVLEIDLEHRISRAECIVPDQSPVFQGHFPGHPILPGVLMIEAMAQTGGWLVLGLLRFARMPFLAQVREAKMRAFVGPGQRLATEARLLHDGSGYAVAAGRIEAEGKTVADAELLYRVVPFPAEQLRQSMRDAALRVAVPEGLLDVA